jgi:hypothetical protein
MSRARSAVLGLAALAACGRVDLGSGVVACGDGEACPADQRCAPDGLCYRAGDEPRDGGPPPDGAPPDVYRLRIEAEEFAATGVYPGETLHSWIKRTSIAGFSGTGYVVAEPNRDPVVTPPCTVAPPTDCGAYMDYDVLVAEADTYYLHLRAFAASAENDSVYVAIDNGTPVNADVVENSTWSWRTSPTWVFALDTSPHVLRVSMREDGFALDAIVLSPSDVSPTD